MFGMAFRAYRRKIQRLSESSTYHGRSLWEAVFTFIEQRPMVSRHELLERFSRDEPELVRAVVHDLSESGLVFCSGSGPTAVYRAVNDEELTELRRQRAGAGLDELIWVMSTARGRSRARRWSRAWLSPAPGTDRPSASRRTRSNPRS